MKIFTLRGKFISSVVIFFLLFIVFTGFAYRDIFTLLHTSRASYLTIIPLTESVFKAEQSLHRGLSALDKVFLDERTQYTSGELTETLESMKNFSLKFETFIQAVIWGGESEVFRKSSYNSFLLLRDEKVLQGDVAMKAVPNNIQKLAGKADLYFAGFSQNAIKALERYQKSVDLHMMGEQENAQKELAAAKDLWKKSRYYVNLTEKVFEDLNQKIGFFNVEIISEIKEAQSRFLKEIGLVMGVLLLFLILAGGVFIETNILKNVQRLIRGAQEISSGNFSTSVQVKSKDEIGQLAEIFNEMSEKLENTTVSKEYVETILQCFMDALLILDKQGKIKYVNEAFESITGYSAEEVIGRSFEVLNIESDNPMELEEFMSLISNRGKVSRQIKRKKKDGGVFHSEESFLAVNLAKDGKELNYMCVMKDITEQKKAEEERKEILMDLKMFKKVAIGRELKMIDLKKEINLMAQEAGKDEPYDL
ncbi:MAG: PAS domain S-box protein [Candidatus Omnitrophica bacterium]|nr:PAS domain S-box protein [Candidatus Omnitrophota bacterium]